MRLPRDLSGHDLAKLLRTFGYEIMRQSGSHLRLTSRVRGPQHHVTIPAHRALKLDTLAAILTDIAAYLKIDRDKLEDEIFSK